MIRFLQVLLFLLPAAPMAGQNLFVYPQTTSSHPSTLAAGSTQSITAVVTGVNVKTVTWSTTGGTLIGANPCVSNEPCTIGLTSATAGGPFVVTATTTVGAVTATSAVTFTGAPTPISSHPRFLFTPSNVSAMQAKCSSLSSTTPCKMLHDGAVADVTGLNSIWSWKCNSGTGQPSSDQSNSFRENDAFSLVLMGILFPTETPLGGSCKWGDYGHDVWVYVMTHVLDGSTSLPQNHWSDTVTSFALTGEWCVAVCSLTSGEKLQTQAYLAHMAQLTLQYFSFPDPTQPYNSSGMFTDGPDNFWNANIGNNYEQSVMMYQLAAGFTFNDNTGEDPPLTNTCSATRYQVCPDYSAGSLAAYGHFFMGGLLYLYWGNIEDPNISWLAYNAAYSNLPTPPTCIYGASVPFFPCFGQARQGEAEEGSGYAYSIYRARYMLNMLHSAGLDDPAVWGPQVSAVASSFWDMKTLSDREFLTNNNPLNNSSTGSWGYLNTGDTNAYYHPVNDMWTQAAILTYDQSVGRTDRTNATEWLVYNSARGGQDGTNSCSSNCGIDNNLPNGNFSGGAVLDVFLGTPATDPQLVSLTDPLASMPLDLYVGSLNQHQIVRSSASSSGCLFTTYWPNTLIDHAHQWAGRFDLQCNGEFITKGRVEFDNAYNDYMSIQTQNNGMSLFNSQGTNCPPGNSPFCFYYPAIGNGGQMWHGIQSQIQWGLLHSELPAYVSAHEDTTPFFNTAVGGGGCGGLCDGYTDVNSASRSIVYLRGSNLVAFYDRSSVQHAASVQALSMTTTGTPTCSGSVCNWLTRSTTQKAYLTSLLPAGGTVAPAPLSQTITQSAPHGSITNGTTMQVHCVSVNGDSTTTNIDSQCAWDTTDHTVATVSSSGLVTAVGIGTAMVESSFMNFFTEGPLNVISGAPSGTYTPTSTNLQFEDWEPAARATVTPSGTPLGTNFLSTLEFGASGFSQSATSLVSSTAGQNFDGALVGTNLVMFMRNWPNTFTGTTFAASGATSMWISDLTPNTSYPITGAGVPGSATTDTAGVLAFSATGTGNISVGAASGPTGVSMQGVVLRGHVVQ